MKIMNVTKNSILAENVEKPRTLDARVRGLIGYTTPRAMWFTARFGIHTFGVRFPIDVLVCDEKGIITTLRQSLLPNRFFFWNPRYMQVFELPEGTIFTTQTVIGDTLIVEE